MTLAAVTIKNNYVTLLGNNAGGQFRVIGYQSQAAAAEQAKNNNRTVQVRYDSGNFEGGTVRNKVHEASLKVIMRVTADAHADVATLESESTSVAQKQTAISNIDSAANRAETLLDELFDLVWNITEDADNRPSVANWQLGQFQKDDPTQFGGLVTVTGNAMITFRVDEPVTGATTYQPAQVNFTTTYKQSADTATEVQDSYSKTGIKVLNPES